MENVKNRKFDVIMYFLKRHKTLFLAMSASSLTVAFLESMTVALVVPLMNSIMALPFFKGDTGAVLRFLARFIEKIPCKDKVLAAAIVLFVVTVLKGASKVAHEWIMAYSSGKILYDTKSALMKKLSEENYQYFLDHKQGEVGYYLLTATTKVGTLIFQASRLMSELCMIIAVLVLLFTINVYATLACVITGIVLSLFVGLAAKNVSYVLGRGRLETSANQSVTFNEFFNGIKHITVFGMKAAWLSKFGKYNRQFTKLYVRDYVWLSMPTNMIEIFGISALLVAILFLKWRFGESLTPLLPLTGVFAMALIKILPALGAMGTTRMVILGALPDAEAVVDIIRKRPHEGKKNKIAFKGLRKDIVFKHVSFVYGDSKKLLEDLNFVIEKNKITAIAGRSGAGKTTIANLLLGLFTPSGGSILVDDMDISQYDIDSFRKKIGFVSQDPFIFHSTISDNIAFGSNEFSGPDIINAARLADIHDFIMSLKDGYDTVVGERGMKLSGGQQQKLAIARALLRKPEILILDEATSALDGKSEEQIYKVVSNLAHEYTIIMIAHRFSTVKSADKIVVLDSGRISEEGRHEELLEKKGIYCGLYTSRP